MNYEDVKNLKPSDFKRLCGVSKETFAVMCEVVSEHKRTRQGLELALVECFAHGATNRRYFDGFGKVFSSG